eukprot:CAMPEP_0204526794 /NCGR_PEP_ID=MMETSP0661-20131031/8628_1 /ASSEMBLY_ACC=CAM_ASM_000606 /TAXON_ID=109239 /ORGANISM="Alexandrium margalefi, Strain AMGDE01CS-322" /LENGTH=625 /DNA_ID=CAMNT_0051532655 /DNA_START=30 /DNA_END=1905 /DNA_ORIENTATION=-
MMPPAGGAFALASKVILLVVWSVAEPATDTTCTDDALPHVAVSALQQGVVGEASQLSVAAGTSDLVASLTINAQTLNDAAGDTSLTHEQVARQNKNILAALRGLGESWGNGTTHLSNMDKQSLKDIINSITQTMFSNLDRLHSEDQTEVKSAHAAVVKCDTDRQSTLSGRVGEASVRTQAARESHLSSRTAQSALAIANTSSWSDYENLVSTITPPSCPTFTPTLPAMDVFFSSVDNSYIKWYMAKQVEFMAKKGAYESANSALGTKHSEADRLQRSFENQYCSYKGHEIDMCSTYGGCRMGALASYESTTKRVRLSEASRKAYLKSGHAVICHVKAILGEDNKTHSQCQQELAGVDSAQLDMLYPSVPAAYPCDFTAASASQPCHSTFRSTEYGGLASNVHPTACSHCSWEPPTPAPTSSPTMSPTPFPTPSPPTPSPMCQPGGVVNPSETQRSYSSVWNGDSVGTSHARSMLDSKQAWSARCGQKPDTCKVSQGEWMEIDLGEALGIAGTVTQGRSPGRYMQWVSSYKVSYSTDGINYTDLHDIFAGNTNCDDKVTNLFGRRVDARFVRFYPQTWSRHISMRAGVKPAGHEGGLDGPEEHVQCAGPMGTMRSGSVGNDPKRYA